MCRKIVLILFLVVIKFPLPAQVQVNGNLVEYLEGIIDNLPSSGTGQFANPGVDDLLEWETIVQQVLAGNYAQAHNLSATLGYQLTEFNDTSAEEPRLFFILEKISDAANHWGTYVFNTDPCRSRLVFQAPHPKFDTNTGIQSAYLFNALSAKALFISGTHRCNASVDSECSGTTGVCGATGPYKISDMAHNAETFFQKTTEVVLDELENPVFVQMHGFAKGASDPDLIVSNGTRIKPAEDFGVALTEALTEIDLSVTYRIGHVDLSWDRLLAFTNTQGRLINGSLVPCTQAASNTQGRFIHLEQALNKFRIDEFAWELMLEAMEKVFTCDDQITANQREQLAGFKVYPNPFQDQISFIISDKVGQFFVKLTDWQGRTILQQELSESQTIELNNSLPPGIYFYHLTSDDGKIATGKIYKTL